MSCKECGAADGACKCDGYGSIVHHPSSLDQRVGESRRLHTPCPGCEKCATSELRGPDGVIDPHLTDEEVERQLDLAEDDRCHLCGAPDTTDCECSRPRGVTIEVQMTTAPFIDPDMPDTQQRAELATTLRRLANTIQRGRGPLTDEVVVDSNTLPIGQLNVHTGEPKPRTWGITIETNDEVPDGFALVTDSAGNARLVSMTDPPVPSVKSIASFLALMQGGGGLAYKSPTYLREKFNRLLCDEGQTLDRQRGALLREWERRWGHLAETGLFDKKPEEE